MKKTLIALTVTAALLPAAHAGTLRIGASPVPHAEILNFVKPILAKQGVTLDIKEFNDYVQPNLALADGSLDLNFFQHKPYLDSFQQSRPLGIVPGAKVHIEPMGLYSSKIKKVLDIKPRATIAVPNDPSNEARALQLLQRAGLIRLKASAGLKATPKDITSNVKNISIREIDAAQLPRTLNDVDAAIINTNYALTAGLNPTRDALILEDKHSPYANFVAGKPAMLKNPDYLKLVKVLQSPATKAFILKKYNGAIIPAF